MTLLVRFALRNLARHPWRTASTVTGIALGISAVLATLSLGDNVEANLRSTLEAAAGKAALLVTSGSQGRAVLDVAEAASVVGADPAVAAAYPVLNYRAEPLREIEGYEAPVLPGVDTGFQLSGRLTESGGDLPTSVVSGALPTSGSAGIALSAPFAETRGLGVGDMLRFATRFGEVGFTVSGLLDGTLGLATTNGGRVGVVHLDDLQSALRLEGRASYLELILEPSASASDVMERLQAALGDRYSVVPPATSGSFATGMIETLQAGLSVLAVTLLALGGFIAYNTFTASALERRREYALLRTIALTRRDVQTLAVLEAFATSLLGVAVGVALGYALAYGIVRGSAASLGFEFRTLVVPFGSVLLASALGCVVAVVAGLLPARAASRTPPIAAARRADSDGPPVARPLGWLLIALSVASALLPWRGVAALGGTALAMSLFFVGVVLTAPGLLRPALALARAPLTSLFASAGKLGMGMTERNATRNGVAIGTVIVSTGLIIGVAAMVAGIHRSIGSWVDTTVVGDLFVTSPVSFPEDFAARAAELDEIDVVSGVGLRAVRFEPETGERGRTVAMVLVEADRFHPTSGFGSFQFMPGEGDAASAYAALRDGGAVLAANTVRERFGVGTGDRVRLRTADGFAEFQVAGVIVDFTGGGEAFVAGLAESERFGGGAPDLFVMTVGSGVDPAAARLALTEAFPELFLDATLNAAYRERILTLTQRSFASTNALLVLAVVIAGLGVANTLGMNLASRRHEIAVLRTLGLTRSGVRAMVMVEGIVIVAVGAVLGAGFGLLLAQVITRGAGALTGFALEPVLPWGSVVLALAMAPVVGLTASLLPARRAARWSPTAALGASE